MVDVLRRLLGFHDTASRQLVDEIRDFRKLKPGWDSYAAPDISDTAIKAALHVVEIVSRRRAPLPSAAPTPLGGVVLTWDLGEMEARLLIDDESFDFSVARRGHPKVIDQGSLTEMQDVERRFLERHIVAPAA